VCEALEQALTLSPSLPLSLSLFLSLSLSQEEKEALEQALEHQKFRASKKQDEIGVVDETGGIEDETSVRAFRFSSRVAYCLDDDSPGWSLPRSLPLFLSLSLSRSLAPSLACSLSSYPSLFLPPSPASLYCVFEGKGWKQWVTLGMLTHAHIC
jgi:hypothetical protein